MNRRRQSAVHIPSSQPQGHTNGFKGLLAALVPKKLLHSVSESTKNRTSSPKRTTDSNGTNVDPGVSSRRNSIGAIGNRPTPYSKDQEVDLSGLGLKSSKGLTLFRNVKKPEMIESVKLDHNRFESLPEDLCRCLQLRVLSATDNDLTAVPHWIASLISLNELDLRKNSIQALPESFKCLKRLYVLNLSFNPLTSIDHSLVHCSNLTVLYLNDCCLQFLPATIGRLHQLQNLELRNNSLQSLPSGLCRLGRLQFLDVGGNRLSEFPDPLGHLSNLKVLLADENRIAKLPQNLDGLHALEFFDLTNNALKELSPSIERMLALETLLLSDNYLSNLPTNFGNLPNLKLLRIDRNSLRQLPPAFGRLRLKEFSAIGNELPELPATFYQLCQLEVLFLDQNRLQSLPDQFGDLRNLSILSLRGNKIEYLPSSMGNLLHLITLDLRENRLHSLPTGLRDLVEGQSLKAIWLSHNQATPKLTLNCDIDASTRQKILTCYLLPQQNQASNRLSNYIGTSKRDFSDGRVPKTKRITFDIDIENRDLGNQQSIKQFSGENSGEMKAVDRNPSNRRWPIETTQALEMLDAQHEIVVRTETSFGSLVRQAKVVRSGKISPRLLYQLDKIKNEQRRSIMFQSSAFTIVRNHLDIVSGSRMENLDLDDKPGLFRPPSFIRPYAMIDLKTLQAQVEAEHRRTSMSSLQTGSTAHINANSASAHHEYEAIFDFKKKKNMASMVKNDFQCVFQQQHSSGTARYNSCFSTVAEEVNQYVDLNRSF